MKSWLVSVWIRTAPDSNGFGSLTEWLSTTLHVPKLGSESSLSTISRGAGNDESFSSAFSHVENLWALYALLVGFDLF